VIGLACRFPDSDDPPTLLDTILTGRRAFRRLPPGRLDLADYDSPDPAGGARAGLIEGWQFDRAAFRIPVPDYRATDPAHWLALETAARALAAAGFPGGAGLDRDRIGVIFGHTVAGDGAGASSLRLRWPYVRRILAESLFAGDVRSDRARKVLRHAAARYLAPFPWAGEPALAGSVPATIPARISSYFGFRGGSQAVDGACASSLQAVASACAALAAHDLDVALAGGVDVSIDPLEFVRLVKTDAVATGDVRIYDENPTGYLPGEGCGVVVLMRTAQAKSAGLPIYAEILGWGASAGGLPGIVASDASSHLLALRRAYERAGVDPREVQLIEGHGSGTSGGDDAELIALSELRAGAREPAALGSIKANIGHARAAAGAAGLIKVVLALGTGVIPPTTGVTRPHPLLRGKDAAFWLPEVAEEWPAGRRLAGVSALGAGGVNVHLVLQNAISRGSRYDRMLRVLPGVAQAGSGQQRAACTDRAPDPGRRPGLYLLHAPDGRQLASILSRVADVAGGLSDAELIDLACQLGRDARTQGPARVAIVAGHQDELARRAREAVALLPGLGGGLMTTRPGIFAAENADGRITLLLSDESGGAASAADIASCAEAIKRSLGTLRWLESLDVNATAAVGHGLGEIAGLAWAGVLSEAEVAEVGALRAEFLSGPAVRVLAQAGRPAGRHRDEQPLAPDALSLLRAAMAGFRFGPPRRRLISTVTGRELATSAEVIDLICHGFTGQDRLAEAVAAGAQGATLLVETGPGRLLAATAARICRVPTVGIGVGGGGGGGGGGRDIGAGGVSGGVGSGGSAGGDLIWAAAALFAAGAIGQVQPLFAGRQARPIDIWRDQVFITGPGRAVAEADRPQAAPPQPAPPQPAPPQAALPQAALPQAGRQHLAGPSGHRADRKAGGRSGASHRGAARAGTGATRPTAADSTQPSGRPTSSDALGTAGAGTGGAGTGGAGTGGAADVVAGVAPWVRCFTDELRPVARPTGPADDRLWRIRVAGSYPFQQEVGVVFGHDPAADRSLAILGDPAAPGALQAALAAARDAVSTGRLVVITTGPGFTGLFASLHAEQPSLGITVLRVPASPGGLRWARRYARAERGEFRELVMGADGTVREPVLTAREVPGGGEFPLGPSDVALVSRSSGAAALALAQVLACGGSAVAVIGRADPEQDGGVVAGLEELRLAGARIAYEVVDAADPADMALAVQRIERRLGPVTAIAHAVDPAAAVPVTELTERGVDAHLAVGRAGLGGLLTAVSTQRLRLILTFGSVAGRYGLPRQGLLAAGSTALAEQAEAAAAAIAGCRTLHLELPGWSGRGLGEEPGLAQSMAESGMAAIGVGDAARMLLKILATPTRRSRLAVHGRVGVPGPRRAGTRDADAEAAAGAAAGAELRSAGSFLRDVVVHYPGIELVCDVRLSLATDPYLADYRVDGLPVLPPAMALEALAQAASVLAGQPLRRATGVTMGAPVVLPAGGSGQTLVRICALADGGKITAALRCEESGLLVDHVRAEFRCDDPQAGDSRSTPGTLLAAGLLPAGLLPGATGVVDGAELYGPICFQSGRFRRISVLTEITARSCRAVARGPDDRAWFLPGPAAADGPGELAGRDLLLGSPGLNDATLQVLQACAPDRRGWPAGCDSVSFSGRMADGAVEIRAAAARRPPAGLTWDVEAVDAAGRTVVTWQGVRLREAERLARPAPWPPALLSVYLERGAIGLGLDPDLRITVRPADGDPVEAVVPRPRAASAAPSALDRVPRQAAAPGENAVAAGTGPLAGWTLEAGGSRFAACGWAPADSPHPAWPTGDDRLAAFSRLCSHLSEPPVASAARLQALAACLAMTQAPADAPVLFDRVADDGWALLEAGGRQVACIVVKISGVPGPVAVAMLTDPPPGGQPLVARRLQSFRPGVRSATMG
jgi:enediyne polyketide synthase